MIKIKKYQIEDYISDATQDALDLKADLVDGKVPSSQLPSYVDDVIEVANYAALPIPGETGIIYVTLDDNKVYRWSGSTYVEIAPGNQDLQSVTDIGATTTNAISIYSDTNFGVYGQSNGKGVYGYSYFDAAIYGYAESATGIGIKGYAEDGVAAEFETDSNSANIANFKTSGVLKVTISNEGVITSNSIFASSINDYGVNGVSTNSDGVSGESNSGIGVSGISINGVGGVFMTTNNTNIAEFKTNSILKASIDKDGDINANSFIKSGGTASQILAADGSVITAGTNITITGGQISSVGGTDGGGSSVNYYLNGGTNQGIFGGTTYYEFSKTAIIGTEADFNISSNGYIASFITDVSDPSLLLIPAGNWNLEFFFSSSSAGGSPSFYVELYKYDGTTFTLITSNSTNPEGITNGTSIDAYFTPLAVPETILTVNDRLAIRVFVNASSKTITLHTQNGHLCEVITTFTSGLTALNGLQAQVQNFATGTTGNNFAISSSGSTHTFNLPDASAAARGVVTTGTQTFAGNKTFTGNTVILNNNIGLPALYVENNSHIGMQVYSGGSFPAAQFTAEGVTDIVTFSGDNGLVAAIQSDGKIIATAGTSSTNVVVKSQLDTKQNTITLSAIGSSPNTNAATLTGSVLNLQPASAFFGGVVTTGTQTFAGAKTFNSPTAVPITALSTLEYAIFAGSDNNTAIWAQSVNGNGVFGITDTGIGVEGSSNDNYGIKGISGGAAGGVFETNVGSNIAEFKTANILKASINSDGTFAGTGLNASDQTINTIASFDANKNVVSLTTANGYPTLTELKSLVGVSTTAIQTQLNAKQNTLTLTTTGSSGAATLVGSTLNIPQYSGGGSSSQGAFTVLANNTNASAVPTEQGFRNEPSKAYTGATPTWTGTTAPSGTTNHTYSFSRMGNLVTLRVSLDYSVAGSGLTSVTFDLPSDCPTPELPSGVSNNLDVINYGSGMLAGNRNVPAAPTATYSAIRIKSTGVYEINIGRGTAAAHRYAYSTIQYFTT